ncbi:MAG: hypothetical protein ACYTHJ_03225 [Planctomycetota bacterium]|jgi:hypothetical protein
MDDAISQPQLIHYLPIATTAVSMAFCVVLLRRYQFKGKGAHLLWWATGVFFYGVGTALESSVTLFGNSSMLNKSWYIAGALLGGYPLAQGTVYLLLRRKTAHILSAITLPVIVVLSVLVAMSPTNMEALQSHRPGGAALGWQWIRPMTPLVNLYAAFFLIGGAVLSAIRFARKTGTRNRAIGNALIAFGALLPGIGGAMAKGDIVEALYVGEFVGILFIWAGYVYCVQPQKETPPMPALETVG